MKLKKRASAVLAILLIAGCLTGCDSKRNGIQETSPKETAPNGVQGWGSDQSSVNPLVEYNHFGLQILLDSSYTAGALDDRPDYFTFDNGHIQGGVEFGNIPVYPDGSTIYRSSTFAYRLKEELDETYTVWIDQTANERYYAQIYGGRYKTVRSLITGGGMSWNIWLRCSANEDLIDQMVKILTDAKVATGQIQYRPQTPSKEDKPATVEYRGLQLTINSKKVTEDRYTYFVKFFSGDIHGRISWRTKLNLPQGVDTLQEIAEYHTDVKIEDWDYVLTGSVDGGKMIVVYNDVHNNGIYHGLVRAYFVNDKFYWAVEVEGNDCGELLNILSSASIDGLGYYRKVEYDLSAYSSLDMILQELNAQGYEKWGRYSLVLKGLSTPVTFEMFGAQVETIRVGERTMELTDVTLSSSPDGITYTAMEEYCGAIWLNVIRGSLNESRMWVISANGGVEYLDPESSMAVLYEDADGALRYRRYTPRFSNTLSHTAFDPLEWAISRDELCYEEGYADIWGGQLVLKEGQSRTISDLYDMDKLFTEAKETGRFGEYQHLNELLESNLQHYPN